MEELFGQGETLADAVRIAALPKDPPIWIASGDADPLLQMLGALQPLIERYRAAGLAIESRIYLRVPRHSQRGQQRRCSRRSLRRTQA
ncbi:hypothetical protein G6N82_11665 [Altererythrobacter sp. BO-6]|uniref:hypothetical protein n=1 Tax=Altererythrobacter sp. BO-6 TaxID=2604537 RepID=UPI0013E14A3D|nr:hypothetical protein [Altererythrobacter sp. BO-6]QIG54722.1 hypothetical protein G6N82_11665 [Altererythrobacter sp. BO-6]